MLLVTSVVLSLFFFFCFFFFTDTATTEIYTLSLHDALPILLYEALEDGVQRSGELPLHDEPVQKPPQGTELRSEEHTSELQSRRDLVCRLLLEKKKKKT